MIERRLFQALTIAILLLFLFIGCQIASFLPVTATEPVVSFDNPIAALQPTLTATITSIPQLTYHLLANAEYRSEDFASYHAGFDDISPQGQISLVDGVFKAAHTDDAMPELNILLLDKVGAGDIDGDGVQDALVFLAEIPGGSGVFVHMAVVLNRNGMPVNVSTQFLGDRQQITDVAIEDGVMSVDLLTHGEDDPLCCPSLEVTQRFVLQGDRIISEAEYLISDQAVLVIDALKNRDMETLAALSHPDLGVRFSPYTFVREEDLVFSGQALLKGLSDEDVHVWGLYDGSGEPIALTFSEYFSQFVYSRDFFAAELVTYNEPVSQGNTINNSAAFYESSIIVEYYFSGIEPKYGGMDWRSLRLVFQQHAGEWLLVGIINDEWTI
jgi:hypothetical protein